MLVDELSPRDIVISTTGMLSRELFEYRASKHQGHEKDFLTVGSMGHTSSIALGVGLNKPNRLVRELTNLFYSILFYSFLWI